MLHFPLSATAAFVGVLSLAAACDDGSGPTAGFLSGDWNGQRWAGEAVAVLVSTAGSDTLHISASRQRRTRQEPEESLRMKVGFVGPGEYRLTGDAVWLAVLVGGDFVVASYTGLTPQAGTLTVDAYDPAKGAVKGTVAFETRSTGAYQPYGLRAQLSGGRFEANLQR